MREGWLELDLSEVAFYVKTKIEAETLNAENYISADNMIGNVGGITKSEYVPQNGKSSYFVRNDILVSNIRPYFKKMWFATFSGGCSNDVFILRVKDESVDSKFLFYRLSSQDFFDFMMAGANGTKMPRGNKNAILNFKVTLPPLETQKKIASILSGYDDLIENNLKRIKILEEMAQQTYEEWFVRMRFPGYETAEINAETGLPVGWERVKLGNLGEYLNGFAFKPGDFEDNGFPIIKIKEMKAGLSTDTPRYSGSRVPDKYFVETGDILFSWSATLDVVIWAEEKGYINQHLFKVTPNKFYSRAFVFFSIKESLKIFDGLTTGATMKHIKRKELDFVIINKPSVEIMEVFRNKVDPMIITILNLQSQNQRLREARDILLPRLMMGMVEV